jgi:hypothetical protein
MLNTWKRSNQQVNTAEVTRRDRIRSALLSKPSAARIMKEVDWAFGPRWLTAAGAQAIWGSVFSNLENSVFLEKPDF